MNTPQMRKVVIKMTFLLDVILLIGVFYSAYAVRSSLDNALQSFPFYVPFIITSVLLFLGAGVLFSLYSTDRVLFSLSYMSDFLRTFFLWTFCLILFPFIAKTDYSRLVVISYVIVSFFALYLVRFITVWLTHTEGDSDAEVTSAARGILTMVKVTSDPLSLLQNIRMARSSKIMYGFAKRLFDILSAGSALVLLSPLFLYLVWKIRHDSSGPVFFTQERVGKDGRKFVLYKFRTMFTDAEKYAHSPRGDNDPRVTPVGKMLRRYSLDELPQLLNILLGHMSVVGPRPEMPFIVEMYAPWQQARLRVLPGLTGLWQILGRKDLPLEENLEYDLYYVFNQSFSLDCAIILKTLPHLVLPKGAY